jgi:hypothetical protein
LEEEVRRREEEEIARMLDKAQEILAMIPSEELVEAIRAGRKERWGTCWVRQRYQTW